MSTFTHEFSLAEINLYNFLLRGQRDDVRTYMRKAKRAAALIYAHFKKEFGMPDKK
jgi:hypothetical protein